jgi:hypothetical protein
MENFYEQFDALWRTVNGQAKRVEELEEKVRVLEARLSPNAGTCHLCSKPTMPEEDNLHTACSVIESHWADVEDYASVS